MKKLEKISIWFISIALILFIFIGSYIYVNDYYHAIDVDNYLISNDIVNISDSEFGKCFKKEGNKNAFIFYPGAKVEYTSYSELMYDLAIEGKRCRVI